MHVDYQFLRLRGLLADYSSSLSHRLRCQYSPAVAERNNTTKRPNHGDTGKVLPSGIHLNRPVEKMP